MIDEATIDPNLDTLRFTLQGADIELTTAEVGDLIAILGALRADMLPAVAPKPPDTFRPSSSASVSIAPLGASGGLVLALRHPGYGWLGVELQSKQSLQDFQGMVERAMKKRMH